MFCWFEFTYLFLGGKRIGTQGLMFARQALYLLSHVPNTPPTFFSTFSYFSLKFFSYFPSNVCPGLILDHSPPIYASRVAQTTGMYL
jgi:hypothetical protein